MSIPSLGEQKSVSQVIKVTVTMTVSLQIFRQTVEGFHWTVRKSGHVSPIRTYTFDHDERIDDRLKMVCQGIRYLVKERVLRFTVYFDQFFQFGTCSLVVVSIELVERYISFFKIADVSEIRIDLKEHVFYLAYRYITA